LRGESDLPCHTVTLTWFMARTISEPDTAAALATLSDDELIDRVKELVAWERRASAALVRSLVELDSRKLYLREGCPSLFAYCTHVLHLSEGSAYNRIETARAARRYPEVLAALERGDVTLTAVRMLAPHFTPANHVELLTAARHRSKQQIQEIIASLAPGLAATGIQLHLTLTLETYDKLKRAQALARHAVPDGDIGSILDRALTLLIDDLERRRFARVAKPRPGTRKGSGRRRHIPAAVRRAVSQRDEGRCAFVGRAGRCRETAFLEFHHVTPYAAGGSTTVDNIELRCRAHNQHEARVFFGDVLAEAALPHPPP
jgi:hypothetical protein